MINQKIDYRLSLDDSNVIKCVAICLMLVHHLFVEYVKYGFYLNRFAILSKVCVSLFLVVSGYGMTMQMQKWVEKAKGAFLLSQLKFLVRRFAKFYLNYWVVFFVFVLLGVFVFGRPLQAAYGSENRICTNLFFDFLGLQGFKSYNITWWFNHLIIVLYLLFPLLFWGTRRKLIAFSLLFVILVWPDEFFFPLKVLDYNLFYFLLPFFIGMVYARFSNEIARLMEKINTAIFFSLALVALVVLGYFRLNLVTQFFFGADVDPFIASVFVLLVVRLRRIFKVGSRALVFVGKHSMNMYLVHTFILGYFFGSFIYDFKYPIVMFMVLFGLSLLTSMLLEFIKTKTGFYKLQNKVIELVSN